MRQDLQYYTKLEEIMNSIDINGFTFHEVEEGRDYQWKLECGPQPLDKIEEVVSYRGSHGETPEDESFSRGTGGMAGNDQGRCAGCHDPHNF